MKLNDFTNEIAPAVMALGRVAAKAAGTAAGTTAVNRVADKVIGKQENAGDGMQPADLKRMGATKPKSYVHKDGKTIMVPKDQEQEYMKKGFQKSPLKAEGGMPSSVIKHKQKLAMMTDKELANSHHGERDEESLRKMAWSHGYGKMSSHYLDRVRRGKEKVESLQEEYAEMTKALITKLVKQGKTDEEIQNATGESGLRVKLIRKSIGFDAKEKQIKVAEENSRRTFMKKAAAGAGAVAVGTMAPSTAWPDDTPDNFNFMDKFFSDKILNDPKYKDFKLKGNDFLNMMKDLENKWDNDKDKNKDDGSIEV
jgi:hypothetical protein